MRVIGAEVTTSYDADGNPIRTPLVEGEITEGAVTSASVRLFFSRFLLPSKVMRQSICLHPSTQTIERIQDCTDPFQPFESPQYSPTDRAVTFRLPPGFRLDADTQYRLTVFLTPTPEDGSGFFAFDGAPLDRAYAFDFQTQADDSTAQDEPGPSPETYCAQVSCGNACLAVQATCEDDCSAVLDTCTTACMDDQTCIDGCAMADDTCKQGCADAVPPCARACQGCFEGSCTVVGDMLEAGLFSSCAFGQCHSTDQGIEALAAALDLATPAAIEATAIDATAHQTQMGEASLIGEDDPVRFGRAMPLIDPGNPANSYLVYKVLANDLTFVPNVDAAESLDEGLAEELGRLRASVVVGLPMPAQPASGGPTGINFGGLDFFTSARLLDYWVASGAVTSCDNL